MDSIQINELIEIYKHHLFEGIIPFWIKNSIDEKYGGYMTWLDRDGTVLSTDKPVWMQGRGVWIFARLYNEFGKEEKYLRAAGYGYEFLKNYCFDSDGRMFFRMTRDGKPVRKRRYVFSDVFAAAGFAEYFRATGNEEALELAKKSFSLVFKAFNEPGIIKPKSNVETRNMKTHSPVMIIIDLCKTLRLVDDSYDYTRIIKKACNQIVNEFYKPELKCLLENIGQNGEYMKDIPEGRCINPGHAIESAWFILEEAILQNDDLLKKSALKMLDDSLEGGWDKKYGGIFYYIDSEGKQPYQLEWDMKLWWPHNEALYALLLAYYTTGNNKYTQWYKKVHDWSFSNFYDEKYGEWFGYLHRDGSLSSTVKGSIWKGPFHVPRFYMKGLQLLSLMNKKKDVLQ